MDKLIKEQIEFKINDIDKLFLEYELIFEKTKKETPDLFDMTILGSVLHSFYNATFRHFYRHAYSFQLNWNKMQPLVCDVHMIWKEVKSSLKKFIN